MSIHGPALAVFLLAMAGAALAAEPVRIQPTVLPMLQATAAKQGGASSSKPEPLERVPGPLVYTHAHREADGSLRYTCRELHRSPATAQEERR